MSFGFGFGFPRGANAAAFSPLSLFTGGFAGAWYDPSDVLLNWRTNLLTWTQEFDNAAWTKQANATVTPNSATAPDGTTSADTYTAGATLNSLFQTVTVTAGVVTTLSWYLKYVSGSSWIRLNWYDGSGNQCRVWANIQTGVLGTANAAGSATYTSSSIQNAGNGWYRISLTGTQPGTTGYSQINFQLGDNDTTQAAGVAYIFGAQLELGSTATTYQAITTPEQTYLLYDPQPVLYQDSAGTTPVTAVEQQVGLILDKSQGLVLGSELVVNGDFSNGTTGWSASFVTLAAVSGKMRVTSTADFARSNATPFTTVVGRTYLVTGSVEYISGPENLYMYKSDDGASLNQVATPTTGGRGEKRFVFVATATTTYVAIAHRFSGTVADWDNISVKELPGNHAFQSTAGNRPTLRSRLNLLLYSEQFDNAVWTKSNSFVQTNLLTYSEQFDNAVWTKSNSFVQQNLLQYSEQFENAYWAALNVSTPTANSTIAPDGTLTAETVTSSNSASATTGIYRSLSYAAGHTLSIYAKANTSSIAWVSSNSGESYGVFNLATGAVISSGNATASIISVGNGWYRLIVANTTVASTYFITGGKDSYVSGHPWSTGTWTSGNSIYLWGAQLVQGSVAGDYRATTTTALPVLYTSPIGTLTANSLVAGTTGPQLYQTFTIADNTVITGSVYLKKVSGSDWAYIRLREKAGGNYYLWANLATGATGTTSGSPTAFSVTSVGSGWYRLSISGSSNTGATTPYLYVASADANGSGNAAVNDTILIWGAQLVQGSVAGDYRATTASALPILYTSPIGTLTAMKLCEDAANSQHYWSQPIAVTAGVVYTVSFRAKAAEKTQIVLTWATGGAAFNAGSATFNLSAGTVTSSGAATGTITSLDSGWYLCTTTNTCVTTNAASPQYWSFTGLTTYAGDGTSGIYIWGAQIVPGTVARNYQRITTATDYDTVGFPLYLFCDGSNDTMQSNTITFSTKFMTCVTGDSRTNNAAQRILLELSADSSVNNGSFGVFSPFATNGSYGWQRDNTVTSDNITTAGYTPLTPYVGTGIIDFTANPEASFTVDTSYNVSALDTGASNFGNYPIYIGARAGTSLFFSGNIYQIVFVNKLLSALELVNLQYFVATKCGIAAPGTVPSTGAFYQTGPTLDLVFAGTPTDGIPGSGDSLMLDFTSPTYQVGSPYMVWEE